MKPELKRRWLEALRSDKYVQQTGSLHEHGFCCLGVACEVFLPDTGMKVTTPYGPHPLETHYDDEAVIAPGKLQELLEIDGMGSFKTPVIDSRGNSHNTLTALNDKAGFTFAQIADVIEKQF